MLFSYLIFTNSSFAAPPTIEIFSGSGSGQGPTAGPVTTTFRLNINNPSDNNNIAYTPLTTATYTITESVYNKATYPSGGNKPNLTIGGSGTNTTVAATNVILPLTSYGASGDNMFAASIQNAPTGCVSGSACASTNGGIRAGTDSADTTADYGVTVHLRGTGLNTAGASTTSQIRMGQIKIEFNRPVNNPILQAAGMGGGC